MSTFQSFLAQLFAVPNELHSGAGTAQIVILLVAYSYVLMRASQLMSDGARLLILVRSVSSIMSGVLMPLVGAIPITSIILFSGLHPDPQRMMKVGMGALAGSTVLLLTGTVRMRN